MVRLSCLDSCDRPVLPLAPEVYAWFHDCSSAEANKVKTINSAIRIPDVVKKTICHWPTLCYNWKGKLLIRTWLNGYLSYCTSYIAVSECANKDGHDETRNCSRRVSQGQYSTGIVWRQIVGICQNSAVHSCKEHRLAIRKSFWINIELAEYFPNFLILRQS